MNFPLFDMYFHFAEQQTWITLHTILLDQKVIA